MSFDRLAPHYRWMERLLAGSKLQRCRTAFLAEARDAERVLLVGEGPGRFLEAFLQVNKIAKVTCLDASAAMIAQAQKRLDAVTLTRVEWIHGDALTWEPPPRTFDCVGTFFFLDCFAAAELAEVARRLATAATDDATWLIADFCEPSRGAARWRARAIIWLMYAFFQPVTHLSADRVHAPNAALERQGFRLRARMVSEWGLLHSDLWVRRLKREMPGDTLTARQSLATMLP